MRRIAPLHIAPPAVPALSRGNVIRAYFSVTITSLSRQAAGVQGGS